MIELIQSFVLQIAGGHSDARRDGQVPVRCAVRLDRDAGEPRTALQEGYFERTSGA